VRQIVDGKLLMNRNEQAARNRIAASGILKGILKLNRDNHLNRNRYHNLNRLKASNLHPHSGDR